MPYTNVWDESKPTGAEQANTIDDIFRQGWVNIRERINTIIGKPIGTAFGDPIDTSKSQSLIIPWFAGYWYSTIWQYYNAFDGGARGLSNSPVTYGTYGANIGSQAMGGFGGQAIGLIPIILPVGCSITNIDATYYATSVNALNQNFVYSDGNAYTYVNTTPSTVATGLQVHNVFSGAQAILADTMYYGFFLMPNDVSTVKLSFLKVTYTSPDLSTRI